ncbi:hypothetical protein KEM60_02349 [Austwickia sp. TVS 96-490-7B]|nr:hypothetical protein [Austwickia sp. TVS 96-490-7B]
MIDVLSQQNLPTVETDDEEAAWSLLSIAC